jgi:hypothetical protein
MNILTVMHEIQSAFLGVTIQCKCFLQSPISPLIHAQLDKPKSLSVSIQRIDVDRVVSHSI